MSTFTVCLFIWAFTFLSLGHLVTVPAYSRGQNNLCFYSAATLESCAADSQPNHIKQLMLNAKPDAKTTHIYVSGLTDPMKE